MGDPLGPPTRPRVHGLLLAAGEGRRLGLPKALVTGADGRPWVRAVADCLTAGGCDAVTVVVGSEADRVRAALGGVATAEATTWRQGMGASLAAGLAALGETSEAADAVLVMLVDLPGVGAEAIARLVAAGRGVDARSVVARAAYAGRPGHPVLIGRDHWADLATSLDGDRGARDWLRARRVRLVECGDVATGDDVDDPEALERRRRTPASEEEK